MVVMTSAYGMIEKIENIRNILNRAQERIDDNNIDVLKCDYDDVIQEVDYLLSSLKKLVND